MSRHRRRFDRPLASVISTSDGTPIYVRPRPVNAHERDMKAARPQFIAVARTWWRTGVWPTS